MSLASTAELLVAVSDLKLVQDLRQAILVADITTAVGRRVDQSSQVRDACPPPCAASACQPCDYLRPVPAVDRYEPSRPVALQVTRCGRQPSGPPPITVIVVEPQRDEMASPLQPPWKVLPWENPPQPARVIKVVHRVPDTECKGTLLDCFI